MGHLVNGNGGIGDGSRKRIFENGGFSDGPVLKFKKRRVSAIRDFPPGCGRNALPINGRLKENGGGVEGLDGGEEADVVESNSVVRNFPPGCGRGVLVENVKPKENGGVFGSVEGSDGAEGAAVIEKKDSYKGDLPQVAEPLVQDTTRPVEIKVPTCHIRVPLVSESVDVQPSINVEVEEDMKKFPPRGRVSAVRDFPKGCGWGAARVNTEVELKNEVAHRVNVGDDGFKLKQENTQKSGSKLLPEKGSSPPASSVSKKIGKPATGSVKLSKDVNYKRTFTEKSVNDSRDIKQSQEKPNFSLGSSEDRELVQSLMAKPKCPWVQGNKRVESPVKTSKKIVKSPSSIPSSVEQGKKTFKSPIGNQSELGNEKKTIKSASASQLTVVERAGLQAYDDREIVQALMAAPHCPWKHGKKSFKSPSSQAKKFVAK